MGPTMPRMASADAAPARASIPSSTPARLSGTTFSTSAVGIQAVCTCRQRLSGSVTATAEMLWPTAYSIGVGVLEVGHLLVPVIAVPASQVGTGNEGLLGVQRQLGLKDIGGIAAHVGRGLPPVDQENGDRPGVGRDQVGVAHRADGHHDSQTLAIRNVRRRLGRPPGA